MAPINQPEIPVSNQEQQFIEENILKNRISSEQNILILDDTIASMMPETSIPFHPLSLGQQALWFLYQMAPKSVAYNIFNTALIRSPIDITALHRAWQKIVDRHPILRTTYTTYEGNPFQVFQEYLEIYIQVTDASNWSEDYLKKQILLETDRPFNLERELPWRLNIFTLSPQEHILLLTMHHIASDLWSYDLLFTELQLWYAAETEQLSPQQVENFLPKNLPYTDFVRWQSEMLSSPKAEKHLEYWQKQLSGELPILNLPTDRPRPPIQSFWGETHIFQLDEKLIQGLREVARATGTTLYKLMLAAFFVLLYRYTNQEDIIVGSPMLGRPSQEFKGVVGYFVNPAVLRASISGNLTFPDLLAQVGTQVKAAQKHQDYPFPLLVKQLQPQQDPSRSPLFQASFTWQKQRWCESRKELGFMMEPYPLGHQRGAGSDLDVMMMEMGEVLLAGWQYNTDLFDADTIARMAGHYQTLLEGIVANPDQPISKLPLLTETERHQLLVEWNNTATKYPQDKCIHQLFEERVELTPDAVVVVFEAEKITYRELNAKANQLAHYLQTLGVKSEVLVGICVERSLEMIIGLLGILKAGGAYVPLDPAYPKERLAFMLEDSSVPVLLTQQKLVEKLPSNSARVVCLDSDLEKISFYSQENPSSLVKQENLAYVIYTSGSTGKPKGVLIEHESLVNYTTVAIAEYQIEKSDRILQFSSISFDVSAEEIYTSLASGATLVLRTDTILDSFEAFLQKCQNSEITVLALPTAYWHELTAFLSQKTLALPPSLRLIILGGEKALPERLKTWFECVGQQVRLLNNYGPTEATIGATIYELSADDTALRELPIGCPLGNVCTYILDQNGQPVPIGVPGELHIGGAGLARGYLNRPELTNERFIRNPFSESPTERLYKTGDQVRYLPDGNIEYLGRIDDQVKVRGFRIELGEIEAALSQHPNLLSVAIVLREDIPSQKSLVAYAVPLQEPAPTVGDLRHFLKEQLPDYMIPSAFVTLENLPLTPNGKVDRRALPAPEIRPELELTFVAPRTPLEEILANIWAEVLGIKQIGINDNFFSLGGHSLLATQIISRIGTSLAVEVPLRHLFESPTIASLTQHIQMLLSNENSVQRPPILPIQRTTEIPLSFAQARLWFLDQLQPESGFYNIPNILRLNGQLNISALENSINEIILRHEALRTNFTTQNGKPVQIIQANFKLELPIIDLEPLSKEAREIEAKGLVTQLANQPFNLQRQPLLRSSLLKLGEQDYIFVLVFHHIIADGWSIEILERELSTIYTALCNNQTPVLPELPIQYADFAVWQRNWLTGEVLQTQLNYWQQQLKGIPALLELPADRPRPAIQTYQGTHQSFQLPIELTEAIVSLCKRMGVTPFMLLLTAFQTLLYRLSGQDDIVVGTPVANRHYRETEQLIGFFVNTVALRATNLSLNPSFEELVHQVREVTLGAYAHQDMPFEELVEALQPERSLSHSPVFQVMFGVENEPISNFSLPALKVSRLIGETNYAKFDLDLSFQNTNDGFIGQWEYNTDLFDDSTIARMTGYLQTLLSEIVANPKTPISELPLLTATQQHQLLIEWNHTQKNYPQDRCIHQLFEERVELTPDAVAVVFEREQITYRELNVKANQLAHYLQNLGVKPEVLVGICVERSLEMIIGLLGILKAGGAYVPLDPSYPSERLSFMLENSSVPVLLTQQKMVEKLPPNSARVICLDSDWEEISFHSQENPSSEVQPENLAYVIYTSGSTGKPKGVLIEHRSLVNYITNVIAEYGIEECDRILQFSSISFDVSAEEIYTSLTSGATLVLRNDSMLDSVGVFLHKCIDWKLTVLALPTAYWHELTVFLSQEKFFLPPSLRLVIIGGEKALPDRVRTWLLYVGQQIRLVNNYGPTEATVGATIYELSTEYTTLRELPIGRPIGNVQTYILDENRQPVPIGVPGELYIGGAGLARGYLNRPELTAEKFISNPFSSEPKARLYKTGDRVRYLADGNIEFLGRYDEQVKIRGFRIELGEIETVLNSHPAVREAVVIEREDIPAQKRLIAYLVAKQPNKEIEFWPSVGEYPLDDELLYHAMTNDLLRNQSYQRAINALVRDKVVVEIGTGKDAILARLCVEAGAKKVYAIEASKQAYDSAFALVKELGLSEKIILIHGYSTAVDLPEKVDVCVSEIIGTIGGSEGVAPILQDSQRFLKENGSMIPYRSVTKIAAVSLPEQSRENFTFNEVPAHYVSQVFEHVGCPFDLRLCIKNFPLENIISNSAVFEDLVFTKNANNKYSLNISLKIEKSGKLDGFLLWLNLYVSPNEIIDNLKQEGSNWLPVYFPVFYPALDVYSGDTIEAICTSQLSDNNINPDYRIEGELIRQNGEMISFTFDSFHHQQPIYRSPFYEFLFPSGKIERNKNLQNLSIQNIRTFLSSYLPDYMIPSTFVTIPVLPLTPNGKIDIRALKASDGFHTEQEDKFVAPRTPTEAKLAAIWTKILGLKRIGINDNFFELGGHSLQAASLVSKLSGEMNLKVSVKLLFEHPTIAELALAIEQLASQIPSFNAEVPIAKVDQPVTKSLAPTTENSRFFKLEQRSLLSLFAVGKLAPVDSAALGYLPLSLIKETSLSRHQILQDWLDNLPMWDAVMETKWGRIAGLTLPIFEDELYSDQNKLVQLVIEALEMAGRLGAKTVSLTGLIPSATDYGRAIAQAIEGRNGLPKITTRHATTCSTVVLTIKKILEVSQRSLEEEKVAFIGLGSIGINNLRLMLKCLPHPKSIILCDIYSKQEFLQNLQRELSYDLGFRGSVQIAISSSSSELPSEIYDATLIIGATNVPDILDIDRLKSGTLIVNDSGSHCFSPEQAIKRFEEQKDILFTEGDALQAPHPIKTVLYLPEWIKNNLAENVWESDFKPTNPHNIMGCVLSSLLSSRFDNMKTTVGLVDLETCVQHYQGLERLGFQAADLHCEGYVLPIESNQLSA